MAEIVNLRSARKRAARSAAEKQAAENRARFGASKAAKEIETTRRALGARRLEGHRRENGDNATDE